MKTQIYLEEEIKSEISKDQIDEFSKRGRSISNRVDIIVWTVYVYCAVYYNLYQVTNKN